MQRIWAVHEAYLVRSRRMAEGLAADAAEAIEDGIRDIIDEDAEADAAIRAVLVRQTSQQAMYAARRVADLEAQGDALAFGRMSDTEGQQLYIGRRTVLDGDEPLLVDWRARAAVPFYRATPIEPLGVVHRRHLIYDDPSPGTESNLVDYTDEIFDLGEMFKQADERELSSLRGEAALLASLRTPTGDRMRSVVATIQAEQDRVVRAPADRTLVVQGGPGTGKTVIALHRAAYLLYDQRVELAESGVLLVGPSKRFLRYIADVLPSLGESGVVSVLISGLYRGASVGAEEEPATAELKGTVEMASLLDVAIQLRQRRPKAELRVWYGSRSVRLSREVLDGVFERAVRHRHHNDCAAEFRSLIIERLSAEVYDPSFHNLDEARQSFDESSDVRRFALAHFPPLTPEQALNDLLGSPALLRVAGRKAGLSIDDVTRLFRPRCSEREMASIRWTEADMALLDELLALLGPVIPETDDGPRATRDELDEFALAVAKDEEAEAEPVERADEDGDILTEAGLASPLFDTFDDPYFDESPVEDDDDATDGRGEQESELEDFRQVVESDGEPIGELDVESVDVADDDSVSLIDLAYGERSWQFGHVIVDEAQDLTAMQWRMVVRRSTNRAITIVGDLAQRSLGAGVGSWRELLPDVIDDFDLTELTINYRSPVELDPLVHALAHAIAPSLVRASSLRSSGIPPEVVAGDMSALTELIAAERERLTSGQRLAVIVPDEADIDAVRAPSEVEVLTANTAKGLEFDAVILCEPSRIAARPRGLSLLYVAVTRATSRLVIAHTAPLPPVMADALDSGLSV